MLFHPNIRNLFIGRGILAGLASSTAVTVFSGAQPLAGDVILNWPTYKSQALLHWQGVGFTQPQNGILATVTVFPTPVVALASGTATWAIIWATNVTLANVQSDTLPNASFIIGPVTDTSGNGMVRLASPTMAAGATIALTDASLGATSY